MLNVNQKKPIKKVALYACESLFEQEVKGYSIQEQLDLLRKFSNQEGLRVYHQYYDQGSLYKDLSNKPGLQQLLNDAEQGVFDMVIVWKMNRLSRNAHELLSIVDSLTSCNVTFKSWSDAWETVSPQGRKLFQVWDAIVKYEKANLEEEVKILLDMKEVI